MKSVAVLVPIYQSILNSLETISLTQIHKVLNNYDIIYIEPQSLIYEDKRPISVRRFEDFFFRSVKTYNKLLLSPEFYRTFSDYEYILICQLDVFLFSDRLEEFCHAGYDYFGAPWLNGTPINAGKGMRIRFAGNGGLSLRKVEKTIDLLNKQEKYVKTFNQNEDYFFSYFKSKDYCVAPSNISRHFCIETHVRKCMKMNNGELPFGTHAWQRYDFQYWKPYIEGLGYDLSSVDLNKGNEDLKIKKGFIRECTSGFLRNLDDIASRRQADGI